MSNKKVSENSEQEGITKDSLRYWGIDKGELLKHLKLQELAWYGGDFRDDQSKLRYEPTREDFLLTIPLVEHYLYTHGFKKPSKALFTKRIKEVFGKNLKAGELLTSLKDDISYGFANPFYAVSEKGFITYNWPLRDLITIKNNNVSLKNGVLRQILLLNKFLIYNDTGALKQLEQERKDNIKRQIERNLQAEKRKWAIIKLLDDFGYRNITVDYRSDKFYVIIKINKGYI